LVQYNFLCNQNYHTHYLTPPFQVKTSCSFTHKCYTTTTTATTAATAAAAEKDKQTPWP
jgi:hypothetical protein